MKKNIFNIETYIVMFDVVALEEKAIEYSNKVNKSIYNTPFISKEIAKELNLDNNEPLEFWVLSLDEFVEQFNEEKVNEQRYFISYVYYVEE